MTILKNTCLGESSYISKVVAAFGFARGVPDLADVVMDLFDAALQPSSKKTYGTGQRAYMRFLDKLRGAPAFPFQRRTLGLTELTLAFFIAFLLLEPKINKATTILGYETHVKYRFKEEGCPENA